MKVAFSLAWYLQFAGRVVCPVLVNSGGASMVGLGALWLGTQFHAGPQSPGGKVLPMKRVVPLEDAAWLPQVAG